MTPAPDYTPRAGWATAAGTGWCLDPAASAWRIRFFAPQAYAHVYLTMPSAFLVDVSTPAGMVSSRGALASPREAEDFVVGFIEWALARKAALR